MWIRNIYYKLKHFYDSLSNRTLWILLLLWIILSWYFMYLYLFVFSLYTVSLNSDNIPYKVSLYAKSIWKKYDFNCDKNPCILEKISPFNYDVTVSKDNYNTFYFKFNPKIKTNIKFVLTKEVKLINIGNINDLNLDKKLTREERIKLIKQKHDNFLVLKVYNKEFFFKKTDDNKLNIYLNNKFLWIVDFEKWENKEAISISKVIGLDNNYFLKIWKNNYIINTIYYSIQKIKLNIDTNYVKKIFDNKLLFVTKKWSFIFDINTKKITFFNMFYDFIYLDNWDYIWILRNNDNILKQNLWLWNIKWNLIVYYDIKKKKVRLLKNIDFNISKIFRKDKKVEIEDEKWNIYELLNYN